MTTENNEFEVVSPQNGDEMAIGEAHAEAWMQSYVYPEQGLTEEVARQTIAFTLTEESNETRRQIFAEATENPDKTLYKMVKDKSGKVVGFIHANKNDKGNELAGIYLTKEARAAGVDAQLMDLFLDWANPAKPCYSEVIACDEQALEFYSIHGFIKTDKEIEPFEEKFPVVEMVRPVRQQ